MENIYKELQKLGFSQYECKAYVGLLKHSPVTGYEISKRTGVPRSMIYEVLGKLLDKGAVYTVPSEPVKYSPVPAAELIDRLRKSFARSFDFLEKNLTALEGEREADVIWHIRSDEQVLAEMHELIDSARRSFGCRYGNSRFRPYKRRSTGASGKASTSSPFCLALPKRSWASPAITTT